MAELLDLVKRDADQELAAGSQPDPAPWIERYPDASDEIEAMVEMRIVAHEARLDEGADQNTREIQLAEIRAALQDAVNQDKPADLEDLTRKHPDLETDIRLLAGDLGRVEHALFGEDIVSSPNSDTAFGDSVLGRHHLERLLDTHPFGPLYLARSKSSPDLVETLILRPFRYANDRERFLRGAEKARDLKGDQFAPLQESGEHEGIHYLVFEHPQGFSVGHALEVVLVTRGAVTFSDLMRSDVGVADEARSGGEDVWASGIHRPIAEGLSRKKDHVRTVVTLMSRVAHALAEAHSQGILHHGLSPRAVVIGPRGQVTLRWFGLARGLVRRVKDGNALLRYLAPEIVLGEAEPNWRVDVHGLGAVLHTILRLQPPCCGFENLDDWKKMIAAPPTPLASVLPELPAQLSDLVDRCLARDPADRPGTCAEVADTLDRILEDDLPRDTRSGLSWLKKLFR